MMTCCLAVSKWVSLITVISSRCLPYLCTQEGVSPRIPSNQMMSRCPCGILISQSAISLLTFASAPYSEPSTCSTSLLTACGLVTEGVFMPPISEGTLELSRTTAILFIFQVDDQHEKITDVYVGLCICCVESHLYAPDRILDFVSDIEVDLKVVCDALKAGGDQGKRCTFASLSTTMGV